MRIKDYKSLVVHQPKDIEYLKQLRDSVELGLDGVEKKLERFVEDIRAIEDTLRIVAKMATKAIEQAEESKRPVPDSFKEYIYYMLHRTSMELSKMKQPLRLPKQESEILHELIEKNELLQDLIFEQGGAKGIRDFGNLKEYQED